MMRCSDPQHKLHPIFRLGVAAGKEGGKASAILAGILSLKLRRSQHSAYITGFAKGARFSQKELQREMSRVIAYFASPPVRKVASSNQENGGASDLQRMGYPVIFRAPSPPEETFANLRTPVPPVPRSRKERQALHQERERKQRAKLAAMLIPEGERNPRRRDPRPPPVIRSVVGGFNTAKG
jgi:hypothetical protein